MHFNAKDIVHRDFVIKSVEIMTRILGYGKVFSNDDIVIAIHQLSDGLLISLPTNISIEATKRSIANLIVNITCLPCSLNPEEFEKVIFN